MAIHLLLALSLSGVAFPTPSAVFRDASRANRKFYKQHFER